MIKREESRHDFAFMAGVVIGAVAGAFATLALAPRTGSETRERLRERVQNMPVDDIRARASNLREVAATGTERIRQATEGTSASDVVQTTRSRVSGLVDRSPLPVTLGGDSSEAAEEAEEQLSDLAGPADQAGIDTETTVTEHTDQVIDETTGRVAEMTADDGEDEDEDENKPRT